MFNCVMCRGPMKPLMTSWFCPKNCDRPAPAVPMSAAGAVFEYGTRICSVDHPNTRRIWDVYLVTDLSIHGNWMAWWADQSAQATPGYIDVTCLLGDLLGDPKTLNAGEVAKWSNTYGYKLWIFIPREKVDIDAVAREFV